MPGRFDSVAQVFCGFFHSSVAKRAGILELMRYDHHGTLSVVLRTLVLRFRVSSWFKENWNSYDAGENWGMENAAVTGHARIELSHFRKPKYCIKISRSALWGFSQTIGIVSFLFFFTWFPGKVNYWSYRLRNNKYFYKVSQKKKLFYQVSQKKTLFWKLFWNNSMFLSLIRDYHVDIVYSPELRIRVETHFVSRK